MRYLDIDKTIKAFEEQHSEESTLLNCYNADWIVSFLEGQTTADVQEVRHGHWVREVKEIEDTVYFKAFCSVCNRRVIVKYNYCPHCGAKMGEEEQE